MTALLNIAITSKSLNFFTSWRPAQNSVPGLDRDNIRKYSILRQVIYIFKIRELSGLVFARAFAAGGGDDWLFLPRPSILADMDSIAVSWLPEQQLRTPRYQLSKPD